MSNVEKPGPQILNMETKPLGLVIGINSQQPVASAPTTPTPPKPTR
jgi:hypothetical protein